VEEVTLVFAHDAGIVPGFALGASDPGAGEIDLLRFNRGIRGVGDDEGIAGRTLNALFIAGVCALEIFLGSVEIAECQVRDVILGVSTGVALEVSLGGVVVAVLARHVPEGLEGISIVGILRENAVIELARFRLPVGFPQ
jgi:hypothetical protein